MLVGMNATPLADGVIANAVFTVSPGASSPSARVELADVTAAAPEADAIAAAGSGNTINVVLPSRVSSLSCTPSSMTDGQTAQCTVTLNGPAAAATAVSLGSACGQPVTVAMPSSVTVPSGSSSATFAVQASGVSSAVSLSVVATLNGSSCAGTIGVAPAVAVTVSPASVTLSASQTQQFTANVPVTWSLSPAVGSISATGLYTPPATLTASQTVTVRATSTADPTKWAAATVSLVPPVAVTVSPASVTLSASKTQQFTANVPVTWSLSPAVGTITASGLYTAPATVTTAQTVTVRATSTADTSKFATATVSLAPAGTVTVSPASVSLSASKTQQFTANVAVTWSLSPAVGTISASGLYTAPATVTAAQTVTVRATSQADTSKFATATVSLAPAPALTVSPAAVSLSQGQKQQFTANAAVVWSLSPAVGTISTSGLYTAPATVTAAQTVTVRATSAADSSQFATAAIALAPPQVSVTVSPHAVSLAASKTRQFTASVPVTWSLSPAIGTISASGFYTAPASIATTQTVTVRAASTANPASVGTATITLMPPVGISVSPTSASVRPGQALDIQVTIVGTTQTGVNWSLNPSVGSLANGRYTAPASVSATTKVTIRARTAFYPYVSAAVVITLMPGTSTPVTPPPAPAPVVTIWPNTASPQTATDPDGSAVELGLAFSTSSSGYVTGVRFYKGSAANGGAHTGSLWTAAGDRLATAAFSNESASGWQSVKFAAPVRLEAGASYVVSYYAPQGRYSVTENMLGAPVQSGPLRTYAGGGVYRYGSSGFPTQNYQNSNYWVDVMFQPDPAP